MSARAPISAELRLKVMKRDRYTCAYCGANGTTAELHIDHIVPVARGGSNHPGNLTVSCRACNSKKRTDMWEPVKPSPLGLFLLTFDDNLRLEYQGQIIDADDTQVLVQLYEWLMGSPGKIVPMERKTLYSNKVMLFPNADLWRDKAAKLDRVAS